ncbi:biotin synthase BioB [Clavibacter tessellarius]|uniref:Biotin synthase n=1 Tax=Clavibacter tessellarius TaxID=31965 RepID=A0A225CBI0_9MICO|nr:biotin synthase BioB [Clavibacter michiganensis]MBT1634195.1 biotin synthase BioB [Clavibacter michiganensis]OQJ64028.1 biotin synthase BioB [Clavibacter michiganensis subsp. tessellarius]UKF33000.1 biotin synthase BioB [Clavibacter michiganensis subsp. tessellarius]
MSGFHDLADISLAGGRIDDSDALRVLDAPDSEVLDLVAAVSAVRRRHFGDRVKLNYLVNLKSGMCPEDCGYCSQALGSTAPILRYSWLTTEEAVENAELGIAGGAARVCLVASGRGPSRRDIDRVADIASHVKARQPSVEVCACLGLLRDGQAERLAAAGVDAYNHNINTAESFHDEIVRTHSYADRVDTITAVQRAGVSPCSGLIVGLGESDRQIVEALVALRELGAESVPINFLVPFDGTPMAGRWTLTPLRCLRIVALARLICPEAEIRLAGGRELHLGTLQGLALHVANSMFLGDYLTAEGQTAAADHALIRENGFVIEGAGDRGEIVGAPRPPRPRRRGAGTSLDANA